MSGPPFIVRMTTFPDGQLLAVGVDYIHGVGLAYSIEPTSGKVTGTMEIPSEYGWAQAAASSANGTTILGTDQQKLLLVRDNPLSITHVEPLPGTPRAALFNGSNLYLAIDGPARVIQVDPASGRTTVIDQAPENSSGGGLVIDGTKLRWTVFQPSGFIREVDLRAAGQTARIFPVCPAPTLLAEAAGALLTLCQDQRLALIDLAQRRTWFTPAGSFPAGLGVAPT